MKSFLKITCIIMLFTGCTSGYEVVQPFRNLGYSGDRLFPIKHNESKYSLRIWINNSTSISRVISVYRDTLSDYQASITEFGALSNGSSAKDYIQTKVIVPKSGFEKFTKRIDSLNLFELKNKPVIDVVLHDPFSTYVIEIKEYDRLNSFHFDTKYPMQEEKQDKYTAIQKLIFEEFEIGKRFRFENKAKD